MLYFATVRRILALLLISACDDAPLAEDYCDYYPHVCAADAQAELAGDIYEAQIDSLAELDSLHR